MFAKISVGSVKEYKAHQPNTLISKQLRCWSNLKCSLLEAQTWIQTSQNIEKQAQRRMIYIEWISAMLVHLLLGLSIMDKTHILPNTSISTIL